MGGANSDSDAEGKARDAGIAAVSRGERLLYRRSDDLPGVEELIVHQSPRLWKVLHDAYSVSTGPGTATSIAYRRVRHRIEGEGILVVEPGEVHENEWVASPLDFCVAFIAPSIIETAAAELGRSTAVHFRVGLTDAPVVFRAFRGLHASLARGDDALECQSRLATAVRCLLQGCAEEPVGDPAEVSDRGLARVREALQERFREKIGLPELAREGGISQYHLVRAFARRYGVPPHAYCVMLRASAARSLLATGMPVSSVATEVGFSDQSHLTRVFRRVHGVTPGQYVRSASRRAISF